MQIFSQWVRQIILNHWNMFYVFGRHLTTPPPESCNLHFGNHSSKQPNLFKMFSEFVGKQEGENKRCTNLTVELYIGLICNDIDGLDISEYETFPEAVLYSTVLCWSVFMPLYQTTDRHVQCYKLQTSTVHNFLRDDAQNMKQPWMTK